MKIKEIQALRALAAGLVLLFHAKLVDGGFIGVDIFYVISGFLITGLIYKELENSSHLKIKEFYLRRIKRLLPTSFFVLGVTAISSWIILPVTMRHELGKHIFAASVYLSNFLFAAWGNDYQNLNATPPVVIHYWSLAVEEQFYLFWPAIIAIAYKVAKRRGVLYSVLGITLLSFFYSLYLTQVSPVWAFYILPTRAWELGIGALLLFIPSKYFSHAGVTTLAFVGIIYSALYFNENTPFPGISALLPVISTAILIGGYKSWLSPIKALGNWRFSQWLGEISYPLYLWHWPALVLPASFLGRPLHLYERFLCILFTIIAADLTHRFIEEPIRHRELDQKTLLRGMGLATATFVIISSGIYGTYTETIRIRGSSIIFKMSNILTRPAVYDDACHSFYHKSIPAKCEYGDLTSSNVIVLYGDSHAAQWFPAMEKLALENNFKLVNFTKSACPAAQVARGDQGGFKSANCDKWRKLTLQRIFQLNPSSVIVSGFQHYDIPGKYSGEKEWLLEGQKKLEEALAPLATNLIYISDTPLPERDIPSCLASHRISQCQANPSHVIVSSGFSLINPTPWLCSKSCPSVKNGVVAYRDDSHISVKESLKLIPRLRRSLLTLGAI